MLGGNAKIDTKLLSEALNESAKRGEASGIAAKGMLMLNTKEHDEAIKLLTNAAEMNSPEAMYALAVELASGTNTPRNYQQAKMWMEKAALMPFTKSTEGKKIIENVLKWINYIKN